jgi:phosphomannomutase
MAATPSLSSLLNAAQQFAAWSKTISPVVYELTNETVEAATRRASELEAVWSGEGAESGSDLKALKDELTTAHATRLEFGTAGLRGEMGPGIGRMNDVTVYQAAQGLVEHLVKTYGEAASSEKGIVIGYDHRARSFGKGDSPSAPAISSHRFALLTAIAALARGMKVYLFNGLVCTPMVPYTVLATGALAGVMVTASHNPKKDDGYKVYGHNGAQIISPIDKYIAAAIEANTEPWVPEAYASVKTDADLRAYAATLPAGAGHVIDRTEELVASYIAEITSHLCRHKSENATSSIKIAYTAMHGVGTPFARAMFHAFNHPAFVETVEQCSPDPDFPTVVFRIRRKERGHWHWL